MKVAPSVTLAPMMRGASDAEKTCAQENFIFMKDLANIEPVKFVGAMMSFLQVLQSLSVMQKFFSL